MWSWGPHGRNGLRGWTQSDAPDHRGPREQRLVGPLRSDAATLLALQRAAGNHVVSLLVTPATRTVQRCGSDTDCGCIHDGADEAESSAARPEPRQVQRQAAGNAPELTFEPALNTPPCACVVHVHNEERKAKATARLLHTNCQYNLATVQDPAALKDRNIRVPKHGEKDPNSLFPAKVIDSCMNDEKACRDFLTAKKKSTKRADILDFAQRQYFLAIKDCSNNFAVPVVGLHNNALNDTATYRGAMGGKGVADLKLDVDKRDKQAGAGAVDNIRRLIREKFGDKGVQETLDKEKITNIYRWCGSPDIERCHVGDPDHPDNVVWVTSEADFERLQKTGTNVVLESKEPKPPKSESAGDLSTMFVLLAIRVLDQWVRRADVASGILKAKMAKGLEDVARRLLLFEPQPEDAAAKAKQDAALFAAVAAMVRLETQLTKLRFVNIETEGKGWGKESERVANYRAIVAVFKDLDIHCCTVAGKGDAGVETPIPSRFMELQDVQELSNFFERRVSAFQVGITGSVEFDEAFLRRPRNSA